MIIYLLQFLLTFAGAMDCTDLADCQTLCGIMFFGAKDFYNQTSLACEEQVACESPYSPDTIINECVDENGNVFK
jgi:hypothetical protein